MKAFPVAMMEGHENDLGMDLRDYFASKAMPIIIEDWYREGMPCGDEDNALFIAQTAYKMADAMMEARDDAE